jgi:Fur family ferric uptake transcriptional regulator
LTTKLEGIERACRERGLRMTGPRRVVARVIADMNDHPDVRELHRRAAAVDGRISLATVYRTMKRFEDLGVIERHAFRDGPARYEGKPAMHHDHLIDLTTGRVIEFHSEEIERLQAEIARRLGYQLVGHRLELYAEPVSGVAVG